MRLAVVTMVVGIFALTLAGSWVEGRWPSAAGDYITVTPQGAVDAAGLLWQLRRLDGVRDAIAVLRGDLVLGETQNTGWSSAWLQANYADTASLAFLPPDPQQKLWQGRLPAVQSLDEAVLGYELAQALGLRVGDLLQMYSRPFTVVGIWGPSTRVSGNLAQVSAAAAEAILPSSSHSPDHFVVVPVDRREVTEVARRIWQKMPDMAVLSPQWEIARAQRERVVLSIVLGAAIAFLLLLAAPAWASGAAGHQGPAVLAALLSGAGGLAVGWVITTVANVYARNTLGLTPFQVTPRLALVAVGLAGLVWLLGRLLLFRRSWPLRCATTALLLTLCGAALVTVGMLSESLSLSLSQAQGAATDWVTLVGVETDQRLLQAVDRIPGIRGYMIEARGGLANEDEERWLGPRPPSGVFYGVSVAGGEGTLSVPYRLGYWRGGPLDPEKASEAVVGYDLAQAQGLTIGATMEIRGIPFTIIGIRERLTVDHSSEANYRIDISLPDLYRVLHQPGASGEITLLIPPAKDQEEKASFLQELATRLNVGQVQTIEDRLAQIARSYPAAWTLTPASASEAIRHAQVSYANAVLLCAIFLLVASAISVATTMRDRFARDEQRIGLLKALGSDEGTLLGEYLQMAAVLGVVAGLLGAWAGWAAVSYLNRLGPSGSPELIFTPRLGAAVFFTMTMTAMMAAVAPTTDAVRQDAVWPLYSSSGNAVQGGWVS
jgi:ABC-type lipoprotein release transport system permease subunit